MSAHGKVSSIPNISPIIFLRIRILRRADRIESPASQQRPYGGQCMYREHGQWWSPSLGKNMDFLWFGKFGRPVLLFPTSAGRFYENEDFHLTDSVADKVDAGEIQLVLIDAVNEESWYNKSVHPAVRAARHVQYDA